MISMQLKKVNYPYSLYIGRAACRAFGVRQVSLAQIWRMIADAFLSE